MRFQESIIPGKFSPQGSLSWVFGGSHLNFRDMRFSGFLRHPNFLGNFFLAMEEFVYFLCYPKGITILMLPEGDYNSYVTRKGLQFPTLKSKKADLFFFELVQKRSYKIENFYPLSLSIYDSKIYNFSLELCFFFVRANFCKVLKLFTICWYQLKLLTLSFSR